MSKKSAQQKIVMFGMTSEGYAEATKYLTKIGKLEGFENNKTSVDGYSLIAYANHYKSNEAKEVSPSDQWERLQPVVIGVDVARFGEDQTVVVMRQGRKLLEIRRFRELNTMETAQ